MTENVSFLKSHQSVTQCEPAMKKKKKYKKEDKKYDFKKRVLKTILSTILQVKICTF